MSKTANSDDILALLNEAYAIRTHSLSKSISLAEQALEQAGDMDNNLLVAKSQSMLSFFYMINGRYDDSIPMAQKAVVTFDTLGDERGVADAKFTIASVYYKTDKAHLGLRNLIDCINIYRRYSDFANQARTLKSMGTIYEFFGDVNNAILSYEQAIVAGEKVGDGNMISNVYNPLSGIYLNQNNVPKAMELIEQSIALKTQTGDVRGIAFAYYGRGKVYSHLGKYALAEADFKQAVNIHREMGEKFGQAMAWYKTGDLYYRQSDMVKAIEAIEQALALSTQYNMVMMSVKCHYLLYEIYKQQQNTAAALLSLEEYVVHKEKITSTQALQIIDSYELIMTTGNKELEERLQLEKAEIMEKKNQAEYAAQARQEFLSNMSHEIRTPLNAVTTISQLLKERSEEEDKQLLDSLRFSANNLLYLINDILDFTKLESGKITLESRPTDLRLLLDKIKRTYEGLAKEKGIALELVVDDGVALAYAIDEIRLLQILGNLLSNAIKFTDKGKVQLGVHMMQQLPGKDLLQLSVTDTGTGIPADFLHEIFESFTQPKGSITKKAGGSGLGLAIVKKLVQLHGSDIFVDTKEGEGSVFYFNLWLNETERPVPVQVQAAQSLDGLAVLLAEDNVVNTMVLTKLLTKWGVQADHAKNGLEAVEMAGMRSYDILLMDIHMPEMNGYDAALRIRKGDGPNAKAPLYALTADITAGTQQSYAKQFDGFLRKPIEIEPLFATLLIAAAKKNQPTN